MLLFGEEAELAVGLAAEEGLEETVRMVEVAEVVEVGQVVNVPL
jgi:hypothetical protein